MQVSLKSHLPVIEDMFRSCDIGELSRIQNKSEVNGMARVVVGKASLCTNIARIAWLRRSVEVLGRGNQLGKGIATVDLKVMGKAFVQINDQTVIGGRPAILLSADRGEAGVWSRP